jgi:hypothetical protein
MTQKRGEFTKEYSPEELPSPIEPICQGYSGVVYYGRSYHEGKKITWRNAASALWTLITYRFTD